MNDFQWFLYDIIHTPIFFLAFSFMIKCLFISFYCLILYVVISAVKKILSEKMSIWAHYYIWYALLLSFPLAGLWWNDEIKLPLYGLFLSNWGIINSGSIINWGHIVSRAIILFWLLSVLLRLFSQINAGKRVKKSISQMMPYPDKDGLKEQAANAVGLSAECMEVVVSNTVRSPVSYGILKKTILLPQNYDTRYSLSELYLLLLHEMLHLKNHDTMKLQLIAYAEPFIWGTRLFVKAFKRDTEILCDNRVIGIQDSRSAYEELLLKESINKNIVAGFAFSDSYRTISSRLQALNNYQPEKRRLAFFSVAIFPILLLALCWSYWYPSDWFYINGSYIEDFAVFIEYSPIESSISEDNLQQEQELVEMSLSEVQLFQSDEIDVVYEVIDSKLRVDKIALYEAVKPFERQDMPIEAVRFESLYSVLNIPFIEQELLSAYTFDIQELSSADESDRYAVRPLRKNSLEDIIYLIVVRWG